MKRNYIIAFGILAILTTLALAAWNLFETEPVAKQMPPSREARRNPYLALDRWLLESNISVHAKSSCDLTTISRSAEKNIFIQASLFEWSDEAVYHFINWVKEGGHLFLVLDYTAIPHNSYLSIEENWSYKDNEPFFLLEEFGISAETGGGSNGRYHDSASPVFGKDVFFNVFEDFVYDTPPILVKDWTDLNRLVQIKHGKGKITVSGEPRFLFSNFIGSAPNTRLAWAIFSGEDNAGQNGWLFIRGAAKTHGLLGSLWQEGNFPVLIISILVLLVICFWAVLPMFGLVGKDNERPLKTLRERFLAEGRFLKHYGALTLYSNTYVKEIKRRLARKEGIIDNDKMESRILEIGGNNSKNALLKAIRGERFSYQEFPGMITIFKTILERI